MTNRPAALAAMLALTAALPVSAQRGLVLNEISGFHVVLVVGETQAGGAGATGELPAGARKALNDMREFLPYKHYRVLDAQWTSCCAPRATPVAGRLQGVIGLGERGGTVNLVSRPYSFSIVPSLSATNIPVRFVLTLDDPASRRAIPSDHDVRAVERRRQDLQAEIETLGLQIRNLQQRVEVGTASGAELRPMQDRHASLQRHLADLDAEALTSPASRPIIDSSFTMNAGETVVVGTSKLGGDKALIAIVTAVRKSGRE